VVLIQSKSPNALSPKMKDSQSILNTALIIHGKFVRPGSHTSVGVL
jgi:hypothetical protein